MKQIICFLAVLCLFLRAEGQRKDNNITPLLIGDRMPDIVIGELLNYPKRDIKLSTLDDKLLILQFITTTCGTCIKSIDTLEQVKARTGVDILLVSHDPEDKVRKIIAQRGWKLPVTTDDRLLNQMFPHLTVPHQVWIRGGEVMAITSWKYAREENIHRIMEGEVVKTYLKQEDTIDISKSLVAGGITPYFQSAITRRINNGSSGIYLRYNKFLVYNANITELYAHAFDVPMFPKDAYVIQELGDSISALVNGPGGGITGSYLQDTAFLRWQNNYTFCYNLIFPEGADIRSSGYRQVMQNDLNSFFSYYLGISGSMEQRSVRCLALESTSGSKSYITTGEKAAKDTGEGRYRLINKPMAYFINNLSYSHYELGIPMINATGYDGNIDLDLTGDIGDIDILNRELKKYGLRLTEKYLPIEMLVIREYKKLNP